MATESFTVGDTQMVYSNWVGHRVDLFLKGKGSETWNYPTNKKAMRKYYTLCRGAAVGYYKDFNNLLESIKEDDEFKTWSRGHEG